MKIAKKIGRVDEVGELRYFKNNGTGGGKGIRAFEEMKMMMVLVGRRRDNDCFYMNEMRKLKEG